MTLFYKLERIPGKKNLLSKSNHPMNDFAESTFYLMSESPIEMLANEGMDKEERAKLSEITKKEYEIHEV